MWLCGATHSVWVSAHGIANCPVKEQIWSSLMRTKTSIVCLLLWTYIELYASGARTLLRRPGSWKLKQQCIIFVWMYKNSAGQNSLSRLWSFRLHWTIWTEKTDSMFMTQNRNKKKKGQKLTNGLSLWVLTASTFKSNMSTLQPQRGRQEKKNIRTQHRKVLVCLNYKQWRHLP